MAEVHTGSFSAAKRNASTVRVEQCSPKRFKAMQPELAVVVGKNKVELPTMEPDEWLVVYKFLDPSTESKTKEDIFVSLLKDGSKTPKREDNNEGHFSTALRLLKWIAFFGLESLLSKLDESAEEFLLDFFHSDDGDGFPCYREICGFRDLSCYRIVDVLKDEVKYNMADVTYRISRCYNDRGPPSTESIDDMKAYLLDEEYGNEFWLDLFDQVKQPTRLRKLSEDSRKKTINTAAFECLLEACSMLLDDDDELYRDYY